MLNKLVRPLSLFVLFAGLGQTAQAQTVFIPEGSANQILRIDAATGQVIARIDGLEAVHGLAGAQSVPYLIAGSYAETSKEEAAAQAPPEGVSSDEHAAHHAPSATGTLPSSLGRSILTVLNAATGDVVRRIEVPGAVHHTAVSPDGRFALATHPGGDGISLIDLETLSFKAFIPTGPMPNYAAFSNDGTVVYVSNTGNGTISEVDVARAFVRRNIPVGAAPEHIVLDMSGKRLFAADTDAGIVYEVDLDEGAIARSFAVGGELHGMDISEDHTTLFVSGKSEDKIVAIDLATGRMRTAALGPAPYHLTTVEGTGQLYVSSRDEPIIWIIDAATLSTVGKIAVEGEGHQMVVIP